MDLPQPPADQELKNIIDKLAQFVARNGPEFEHMTKQKQKDNPKFSFLFGGNFFHYYQYRVTTEQAILKQKQRSLEAQQAIVQHAINRQSIQSAPWQHHLHQVQDSVQEQIRQSEQNLAAQHQLLLQQQQVQVDEAIRKAQDEKIALMAKEAELDLKELDGVLQPIIDSCTKDSISTGKGWIFSHATSCIRSEVIILYILKKVTAPGAAFETKLHLVYLINDVLHHSNRKNAEDLKKILERAVVPIFCSTSIGVDSEKQQKLSKLHRLWETNKYFSQTILDQLQNPTTSLAAYQASLIAEHANLITSITTTVQNQYTLLQKQHQDFVAHLSSQMHHLQPVPYAFQSPQNAIHPAPAVPFPTPLQNMAHQTLQPAFEQQNQVIPVPPQDPRLHSQVQEDAPMSPPRLVKATKPMDEERKLPIDRVKDQPQLDIKEADPRNILPIEKSSSTSMKHIPDFQTTQICDPGPGYVEQTHSDIPGRPSNGQLTGPSRYTDDYSPHYGHPPSYALDPPEYGMTPPHMTSYAQRSHYHDMPMGLSPHDMPLPPDYIDPVMPSCVPPYYDLPAGLMVPLVKLEDTDYEKPLDPDDICLPPPALPTDRLLAAVEQFYCPPTHERTRNNAYVISSEGWEQLGLYEFFKAKAQAKKQKGLADSSGNGDECRDYGTSMDLPAMQGFSEKKTPRRRYREIKSPPAGVGNMHVFLSEQPPPSFSPEKVSEAPSLPKNGSKSKRHSRSMSRSRSRSKSPSPNRASESPSPQRPHFQRARARSRSCSPSPGDRRSPNRSPTPPSFYGSAYPANPHDRRLDESNKGHQLLKKMGWSGAGLGATEQGIQDPVDAGDVRDRQDMYKGIGVSLNDPYENFRKSKGQAFINRMKARAEELGKM